MTRSALLLLALLPLSACRDGGDDGTLRASGTIEVTDVRLAAKTPGQVLRLFAEEGRPVRAGDTLVIVDHDLLRLQQRQAEAGRAMAQSRLDLLRAGARSEDIAQARARLAQVETELQRAQEDARRARSLFDSGSTTQKHLDDALARLAVVESQHDAARQALQKVETIVRPQELQAAVAQLDQAEAGLALLERQLADAFLVAPLSGVVTERLAEVGEFVGPGTPVLTLADLSRAYLRLYVPEDALGRIRLGMPVAVYTDAYPDRPLEGRLTFISPEAEFTPKNVQTKEERVKLVYEVKVEVPNPDAVLKPGMYADAVLQLDVTGE